MFAVSHPSRAVGKMLELKGIEYEVAKVVPGFHLPQLRLLGFPGGTVPALRLDGRKLQGSVAIRRALDEIRPDPPLVPADPEERRRVEEAEHWGHEVLQEVPRRAIRWGMLRDVDLRTWLNRTTGAPMPRLGARTSGFAVRYFARLSDSTDENVRADLDALPGNLDRVDEMLADGTLALDPPNAATLQILSTVRAISAQTDLRPFTLGHPCTDAARRLFPEYPEPVPSYLPAEWVPAAA
jgi:glutathione S-transferase